MEEEKAAAADALTGRKRRRNDARNLFPVSLTSNESNGFWFWVVGRKGMRIGDVDRMRRKEEMEAERWRGRNGGREMERKKWRRKDGKEERKK